MNQHNNHAREDATENENPGAARTIPKNDSLGYAPILHGAAHHNNSMQLLQHQNPRACTHEKSHEILSRNHSIKNMVTPALPRSTTLSRFRPWDWVRRCTLCSSFDFAQGLLRKACESEHAFFTLRISARCSSPTELLARPSHSPTLRHTRPLTHSNHHPSSYPIP